MSEYTQTHEDLLNHLCDQLRFLRDSSAAFDNGFDAESKRLATTIRVLFHDTKSSKSLLHQLNMKHAIRMHNTSRPLDPRNVGPHQGLVVMQVKVPEGVKASVSFTLFGEEERYTDAPSDKPKTEVNFVPRVLGPPDRAAPTSVSFTRWWEEVVIRDRTGQVFSRKDLVLALANKEGGAHVDPLLDDRYAGLVRFHSMGWTVNTDEIRQPPDNSIVAASTRQIAHEVLASVEKAFPTVCPQEH